MRLKNIVPLAIILSLTLGLLCFSLSIKTAKADTTSTFQVSQGTDDCWKGWTSGTEWTFYTNKLDDEGGYWSANDYKEGGGMRFQNITIPQGATITNAYLRLYMGTLGMDLTNPYCHNKIRGEDADTSETFSTVTDFDDRNRTTAVVEWNYIEPWYQGNWYDSPNITTIVQEIVDRAGWASGNNMTIFRDDFDDRSAHVDYTARECYAYERGSATAPKLVITYVSGSGDSGWQIYSRQLD